MKKRDKNILRPNILLVSKIEFLKLGFALVDKHMFQAEEVKAEEVKQRDIM